MRCGVEIEVKFNLNKMIEVDGEDKGKIARQIIKNKLTELLDEDVELETGTIYILDNNKLLYNFIYETDTIEMLESFKNKAVNFELTGVIDLTINDIYPDARKISIVTDIIEEDKLKSMDIRDIYLEVYSKFNLFFHEFPTDVGYSVIAGGLIKNLKDVGRSSESLMCIEFGIRNTSKEELDDLIHDLKCAEFVMDAVISSALRVKKDFKIN